MLRKARSNAFPLSFSSSGAALPIILDMSALPVFMFIPGMLVFAAGLLMFIPLLCADTLLISTDAVNVKVVKSLFMWVTSSHKVVISCKGPVKQAFLKAVVSFISGQSVEAAEYLPALVCLLWKNAEQGGPFQQLWETLEPYGLAQVCGNWVSGDLSLRQLTCQTQRSEFRAYSVIAVVSVCRRQWSGRRGRGKLPSRIALRLGSEHLYLIPYSK